MATNKCILKKRCPYYKSCDKKKNPFAANQLCAGYRNYVNQDAVMNKGAQFEIPISHALESLYVDNEAKEIFYDMPMKKRELIIQMFFFDRQKVRKIAEQLYCSEQYVYAIIRRSKSILIKSMRKSSKKT